MRVSRKNPRCWGEQLQEQVFSHRSLPTWPFPHQSSLLQITETIIFRKPLRRVCVRTAQKRHLNDFPRRPNSPRSGDECAARLLFASGHITPSAARRVHGFCLSPKIEARSSQSRFGLQTGRVKAIHNRGGALVLTEQQH